MDFKSKSKLKGYTGYTEQCQMLAHINERLVLLEPRTEVVHWVYKSVNSVPLCQLHLNGKADANVEPNPFNNSSCLCLVWYKEKKEALQNMHECIQIEKTLLILFNYKYYTQSSLDLGAISSYWISVEQFPLI